MDRSRPASGPGWDADAAGADDTAAAGRFPAWLPSHGNGDSENPEQQLRADRQLSVACGRVVRRCRVGIRAAGAGAGVPAVASAVPLCRG